MINFNFLESIGTENQRLQTNKIKTIHPWSPTTVHSSVIQPWILQHAPEQPFPTLPFRNPTTLLPFRIPAHPTTGSHWRSFRYPTYLKHRRRSIRHPTHSTTCLKHRRRTLWNHPTCLKHRRWTFRHPTCLTTCLKHRRRTVRQYLTSLKHRGRTFREYLITCLKHMGGTVR